MLNEEMFALLFKADVCEALSPKGYWHVSVLNLLVPEVLLLYY